MFVCSWEIEDNTCVIRCPWTQNVSFLHCLPHFHFTSTCLEEEGGQTEEEQWRWRCVKIIQKIARGWVTVCYTPPCLPEGELMITCRTVCFCVTVHTYISQPCRHRHLLSLELLHRGRWRLGSNTNYDRSGEQSSLLLDILWSLGFFYMPLQWSCINGNAVHLLVYL